MGTLLAYLTNSTIGILSGLATAGCISIALRTNGRSRADLEENDLADELRTGLRYSDHPGNVLNAD